MVDKGLVPNLALRLVALCIFRSLTRQPVSLQLQTDCPYEGEKASANKVGLLSFSQTWVDPFDSWFVALTPHWSHAGETKSSVWAEVIQSAAAEALSHAGQKK